MDTNQSSFQRPQNSGDQGHKKALLQKLMSNLLNKPGRSMHEIINGIKEAIGAYKNYAREWDALNGVSDAVKLGSGVGAGMAVGGAAKNGVQAILDQIKQQKGQQTQSQGQAIPREMMQKVAPMPMMPNSAPLPKMNEMPPKMMPVQSDLIAGQQQQSDFNRPAPVNNLGIHGF